MTVQPTFKQPQGPAGKFLVGNIPDFQHDPLSFITKMAQAYGDVARYRLGNITMNQINHPEGIQRILQENNHNYIKGNFWDAIRQVARDGLFTSNGDFWLRQRRLMQPSFHRQRIASFAPIMTRATEKMLEGWEAAARNGEAVDVNQSFTDLTMQIITETMFSTQMPDQTRRISGAIAHLLDDITFRFTIPFYPKMHIPTPRNLKARASLRIVDDLIRDIIRQRRESGVEVDDLLGMLMGARDEETGEGMNDEQVRDEVVTIFTAGHETTAVLLTWMFYLLAENPLAKERVYADIRTTLGGRLPGMDDLPGFAYLRMVIDETLRLYPPVWLTNREAVFDDVIRGYRIPAGEIVAIPPYVVHRLPEYWENPSVFDPERFSPERSKSRPRFAYVPFGAGPHQCLGNNFALVEAQLIMGVLAQRFDFRLAPGQTITPQPLVTLRPKGGLWINLEKIR